MARFPACRATATHYFYENKLESDGSHTPLGLAPLPVLHDERVAPRRLRRRLLLFDRRRRDRGAPLRRQQREAVGRRPRGAHPAGARTIPGRARSAITIDPEAPAEFTLKLRIPGWARGETLAVNGEAVDIGGAQPRLCRAPPAVVARRPRRARPADAGRAGLRPSRRPHGCRPGGAEARPAGLLRRGGRQSGARGQSPPPAARHGARRQRRATDLFDGIVCVAAEAKAADTGDWNGNLYRTEPPAEAPAKMTAVPYYLWNNRGPGRMMVWIPET